MMVKRSHTYFPMELLMMIYTSGTWTAQEMEGVPESWDRTEEVVLQTSDYTTMGRFLVKWM